MRTRWIRSLEAQAHHVDRLTTAGQVQVPKMPPRAKSQKWGGRMGQNAEHLKTSSELRTTVQRYRNRDKNNGWLRTPSRLLWASAKSVVQLQEIFWRFFSSWFASHRVINKNRSFLEALGTLGKNLNEYGPYNRTAPEVPPLSEHYRRIPSEHVTHQCDILQSASKSSEATGHVWCRDRMLHGFQFRLRDTKLSSTCQLIKQSNFWYTNRQ